MNLQQTLKKLLLQETEVPLIVRRRTVYFKEYLYYEMEFAQRNNLTCKFNDVETYTEYIIEETILRLYHGWFTDRISDDFSEEWSSASAFIEEFIREHYIDDIENFYNSRCT